MLIHLTPDQRAAAEQKRAEFERYADEAYRLARQRKPHAGALGRARIAEYVLNSITRPYGPDDEVAE